MNYVQQLQNNNEDKAQARQLLKQHMLLTKQFFEEYRTVVAASKADKARRVTTSTLAQSVEPRSVTSRQPR